MIKLHISYEEKLDPKIVICTKESKEAAQEASKAHAQTIRAFLHIRKIEQNSREPKALEWSTCWLDEALENLAAGIN